MGSVLNGRNPYTKIPGSLGIRILAVMCMLGMLLGLFGCSKSIDYPFDTEKAYYYSRQGVIAGGGFRLEFSPEGIVEYHSYAKPARDNECGMRDRGADIYFVGLKEGRVEVTLIYEYPTCEDEVETLVLKVDKDLHVTKAD